MHPPMDQLLVRRSVHLTPELCLESVIFFFSWVPSPGSARSVKEREHSTGSNAGSFVLGLACAAFLRHCVSSPTTIYRSWRVTANVLQTAAEAESLTTEAGNRYFYNVQLHDSPHFLKAFLLNSGEHNRLRKPCP